MRNINLKCAFACAVLAAVATGFAADDLPKASSFARYEPMMNRSPFAVATAAAPLPAATPNFAKDLYIANAARTPDGDLVTVASSADKNFKKYLSTKAPVDGYSVPNIEWSDRVGATKVTISKDGQTATLTFNQALLTQPLASGGAMPPPLPPQQLQPQLQPQIPPPPQINAQAMPTPGPVTNVNAIKAAPVPSLPSPPASRVRGIIQRNPQAPVTAPQPAVPVPVTADDS